MTAVQNLVGTMLGVYEIQALLGSGGMAAVYRAHDTNLQRPVAIKVLSQAAAADPNFVARFRQEARLIASLRHPHVVHVYDMGESHGLIYMVQELLPGPTLEEQLSDFEARQERFAVKDVLAITTQLAGALDAAHAAGIIHRDVKPGNALWNSAGALVLTDFGIAKSIFTGANKTQTGVIFGTPYYMSPEQAQGMPLTPASDIYSLGVVLYELIAGKPPFDNGTPMNIVISHVKSTPPSLRSLRADVPDQVEAVVRRALHKNPKARFASAGELALALERAWPATPAAPPPPAPAAIHEWATRAWRGVRPAPAVAPAPGAANTTPPQLAAPRVAEPAAIPRWAPADGGGSHVTLGVLGALLAIVLVIGAALAVRGSASEARSDTPALTSAAAVAPTAAVFQATAPAAAAPAPTATAEAPPADPQISTPIGRLRDLFGAAIASGEIGPEGGALLEQLDLVEYALASGDRAATTEQLHELQKQLLGGARNGTIPPALVVEALASIDALADGNGLALPLMFSGA